MPARSAWAAPPGAGGPAQCRPRPAARPRPTQPRGVHPGVRLVAPDAALQPARLVCTVNFETPWARRDRSCAILSSLLHLVGWLPSRRTIEPPVRTLRRGCALRSPWEGGRVREARRCTTTSSLAPDLLGACSLIV